MSIVGTVMDERSNLPVAYADYQRARGLSTNTVRRRSVSLGKFRAYISPCDIADATTELVEDWLESIPVAATRRAYRSDLSAFYTWAVKRRLAVVNPVADTDSIRVHKTMPRPVAADLIGQLIDGAPDREVELAVALAAYAGLRRSEVANLRRDDIVLGADPPVLFVRNGKGGRDRTIPINPRLRPYLEHLPAGTVVRCGPGYLGAKVAEYLRSSGVDATMHALRHTFGTEGARVGDVVALQALMGHEDLATTSRYVALTGGRTQHVINGMYGAPTVAAAS